jgi:predicted permease
MDDPLLPPKVRPLHRLDEASRVDERVARDVADEIAFHIAMRAEALQREGLPRQAAWDKASSELGDAEDIRTHARRVAASARRRRWLVQGIVHVLHDARNAARQLRRAPVVALAVILTIALGIGANGTMFSIVHRLVLDPLPFPDGDRMVLVKLMSGPLALDPDRSVIDVWQHAQTVSAWTSWRRSAHAVDGPEGERAIEAAEVDAALFDFVGTHPQVGRDFVRADEQKGSEPVAILGDGFWRTRYGGDINAIGRLIRIDSTTRRIVGVAPPGMTLPFDDNRPPELFLPRPSGDGNQSGFAVIAKPRDVASQVVEQELTRLAGTARVEARLKVSGTRLLRPADLLGARHTRAISLLFAATAVLLLIVAVNVTHLLLARAWVRQREFAIRATLGASRGRVAREAMLESVFLAITGALGGLALSWSALHLLPHLRPVDLDFLDRARLQTSTVAWSISTAVVLAAAIGVTPAVFARAQTGADLLRTGGRVANLSRRKRRVRVLLMTAELSLSVVLLVGAGLLIRSYVALQHVPLGFDAKDLAILRLGLPAGLSPKARPETWSSVLRGVRAIPGVSRASVGPLPTDIGLNVGGIETDAYGKSAGQIQRTGLYPVLAGYFEAARIPLRGRDFAPAATTARATTDEIIINESLARRLWPHGDAIGQRLRLGSGDQWKRVIGVAADVAIPGRSGDRYDLQVYLPSPMIFSSITVVVRTSLPVAQFARVARALFSESGVTVVSSQTAQSQLRALTAPSRFAMALFVAFGSIATILAVIGLYGLISYTLAQRTHEVGIRVALGARPRDVAGLVFREILLTLGLGLLTGLIAAATTAGVWRAYLFNIQPVDLVTYVGVAAILSIVALMAAYAPTRRALRIDPVRALSTD